ncbi:MAG: hypothetical protein ACU833_01785 [Gammaproteobacteria bacterium]
MNGFLTELSFLFGRRPEPKVRAVRNDSPVYSANTDRKTGVERYLNGGLRPATGVAKYLENAESSEAIHLTGVEKYLEKSKKNAVAASIVARYRSDEVKKAEEVKEELPSTEEPSLSGVSRYLNGHTHLSGVSRYIANHGVSGRESAADIVVRYLESEKTAADEVSDTPDNSPVLSSVTRYLAEGPKVSLVDRYIAYHGNETDESADAIIARYRDSEINYAANSGLPAAKSTSVSGVSRYLLNGCKLSSVGRYVADLGLSSRESAAQIIARYLEEEARSVNEDRTPTRSGNLEEASAGLVEKRITSVCQYLERNLIFPPTGVDRYLKEKKQAENDSNSSTVAKYMEKTAKKRTAAAILSAYMEKESVTESSAPVVSSVSRYIKKNPGKQRQLNSETGVARYYEELEMIREEKAAAEAIVAKYLEAEALSLKQAAAAKASGVDKYLEKQAEMQGEKASLSRVARYMNESARKKAAASILARYIDKEAKAAEERKSREESQSFRDSEVADTVPVYTESTVEKYLKKHARKEGGFGLSTRVSNYLEEQTMAATEKAVADIIAKYRAQEKKLAAEKASSVERYLSRVAKFSTRVRHLTSVDKYLEKKAVVANELAGASRVEKYLRGNP